MYHLVAFSDSYVEIIYYSWIEQSGSAEMLVGTNVQVAFPPKQDYQRLRTLLREKICPTSAWESFKVAILYSHSGSTNALVLLCVSRFSKFCY
jgi:hypothetical protein